MKTRKTHPGAIAVALSIALLAAGSASAQSSVSAISGHAAAGDTVSLRSVDAGFKRELPVRANGKYQMRNLPVGTYEVTVRHADGSPASTFVVTTQVGITTRIN